MKRRLIMFLAAALVALTIGAPAALAGGEAVKCNSGIGNGQETTIENDCDPGNSGGHNNGGG